MSAFNTERLKQLVGYAIRGAGFNKLLELSSYIGITVQDGMLYLNTTDGTNYLNVSDSCIADDMNIVVDAELFAKLINKINTDTVNMNIVGNTLVITGNGKYTLELIIDEQGNHLSFPDKFPDNVENVGTLSANDLITISTSIKASLSNVAGSVYSSYYFGDIVASTDRCMVSVFNRKPFESAYLLNKEFVDLMTMSGADVRLYTGDNMIGTESKISERGVISVCSKVQDGVSDFNVDGVKKFLALDVGSFCRIRKSDILDLLDRLSLFVSKFDDGAIQLAFTSDGLEVSSMASNGIEKIEFVESKDSVPSTVKINIDRLRNQLKAYSSDMVDLYYGSDVCIKLVDGDMTQISALIK